MSPTDYCIALGKVLTSLRTQRGLTTKDVAERLDIRKAHLVAYELGDLRPPLPILRKLTTLYEVGLLRLLVSLTEADPLPATVDGPEAAVIEDALLTLAEHGPVPGRLTALRRARGLYEREAAKHAATAASNLRRWETVRPPLYALDRLAPLYGHALITLLIAITSPAPRPLALTLPERDAEIIERALLAWGGGRGAVLVAQEQARRRPVSDNEFLVRLGHTLQYLRTRQGWSVQQLADRTNVLAKDLTAYENALTRIPLASLDAVSTALGVGLLRCLVHAAEPASADVPELIGCGDALAIETALTRWDLAAPLRSDYAPVRDSAITVLMGQRLKELREERGLSRMTVATDVEVTWENLRFIEEASSRPSLAHLDALARRYGLSLLPLLPRLTAPPSHALRANPIDLAIGGDDEDRIVAALLAWDVSTGRTNTTSTSVGDARIGRRSRKPATSALLALSARHPFARALGQALAHFRTQTGLSRPEAAAKIKASVNLLKSVEIGASRQHGIVVACCEQYGVGLLRLLVHLNDPTSKGLPASVGGADETRIVTAIRPWAVAVGWSDASAGADYAMRIGATLESLRTQRGLSQMDVPVDTRTLALIERGERIPRLHLLKPIADFYGVGLLSLLAHLADPTWPIDQPIGGPDADRVTAALLTWDSDPHDDYTPPAPLQAPLPPVPLPGTTTYTTILAAVLRNARLSAGHTASSALGDRANIVSKAERTGPRPSLARIATLADAYGTSLLTILGQALDPTVDPLYRPGGRHAETIVHALLAWEAGGIEFDYRIRLGRVLRALRRRCGIHYDSAALPRSRGMVESYEDGIRRPSWPMLVMLARAYGVNLLALLCHVASPGANASPESLVACDDTHILDPTDPTGLARLHVADAPEIVAAVTAWADKSHALESAVAPDPL